MKYFLLLFLFSSALGVEFWLNTYNGRDVDSCGSSSRPCASMTYILNNKIQDYINLLVIHATGVSDEPSLGFSTPTKIIGENGFSFVGNTLAFSIGPVRLENLLFNGTTVEIGREDNEDVITFKKCQFLGGKLYGTANQISIIDFSSNRTSLTLFASMDKSSLFLERVNLDYSPLNVTFPYVNVKNCSFTNSNGSSALSLYEIENLIIDSSNFTGNSCDKSGGALYMSSFSMHGLTNFTNCRFMRNTCTVQGGALMFDFHLMDYPTINMKDVVISNNSVPLGYGGGIAFSLTNSITLNTINTVISNNFASMGGGIFSESQIIGTGLLITNNSAEVGSGISTKGSVSGATVSYNRSYKGSFHFHGAHWDTITNVFIVNNTGEFSGGIYFESVPLSTADVTLLNNAPLERQIYGKSSSYCPPKSVTSCSHCSSICSRGDHSNICISLDSLNPMCNCQISADGSFSCTDPIASIPYFPYRSSAPSTPSQSSSGTPEAFKTIVFVVCGVVCIVSIITYCVKRNRSRRFSFPPEDEPFIRSGTLSYSSIEPSRTMPVKNTRNESEVVD